MKHPSACLEEPEIRCATCNRLLARGRVLRLTIKCPRCKALNRVDSKDLKDCGSRF